MAIPLTETMHEVKVSGILHSRKIPALGVTFVMIIKQLHVICTIPVCVGGKGKGIAVGQHHPGSIYARPLIPLMKLFSADMPARCHYFTVHKGRKQDVAHHMVLV